MPGRGGGGHDGAGGAAGRGLSYVITKSQYWGMGGEVQGEGEERG